MEAEYLAPDELDHELLIRQISINNLEFNQKQEQLRQILHYERAHTQQQPRFTPSSSLQLSLKYVNGKHKTFVAY